MRRPLTQGRNSHLMILNFVSNARLKTSKRKMRALTGQGSIIILEMIDLNSIVIGHLMISNTPAERADIIKMKTGMNGKRSRQPLIENMKRS